MVEDGDLLEPSLPGELRHVLCPGREVQILGRDRRQRDPVPQPLDRLVVPGSNFTSDVRQVTVRCECRPRSGERKESDTGEGESEDNPEGGSRAWISHLRATLPPSAKAQDELLVEVVRLLGAGLGEPLVLRWLEVAPGPASGGLDGNDRGVGSWAQAAHQRRPKE